MKRRELIRLLGGTPGMAGPQALPLVHRHLLGHQARRLPAAGTVVRGRKGINTAFERPCIPDRCSVLRFAPAATGNVILTARRLLTPR